MKTKLVIATCALCTVVTLARTMQSSVLAQAPAAGRNVEPVCKVDLKGELQVEANISCYRVTMSPGGVSPEHTHTGRSSIIAMVQGRMTEYRGSVAKEYGPGDVVVVPAGATHRAENNGTTPVIYIETNVQAGAAR
jgi:quercetin dioxygenase-like cupin family protein